MGWSPAPVPGDEAERLAALRSLAILDTRAEAEFDSVVRAAAQICNVPIALVSLVDENRQWFKAKVGLAVDETPREHAYCAHAILGDGMMEVPDASLDPRFADHPLRVGEPHVNFYAGVPIKLENGHSIGTLCVIDSVPRKLSDAQREALDALAAQVVRLIELRTSARTRSSRVGGDSTSRVDLDEVATPVRKIRSSRLAIAIAVLLGAGSVVASVRAHRSAEHSVHARLVHESLRVERFIEERANTYAEILRGSSALFVASEDVTPAEFRAYVDALSLPRNYPGVLGLGLTRRIPRGELDAFVAEQRALRPAFRVHGIGDEPELAIITFIEPIERNREALGFDMRSEPRRSNAIARADRADDVAVSEGLTLLQDPHSGPGYLFLFPIDDRAHRPIGWAFAVVRGQDLVRGLDRVDDVTVRLRDASNPRALIGPERLPDGPKVEVSLAIADRRFDLALVARPSFATASERNHPWIVFFLGLGATALTVGLVAVLRSIEARSTSIAAEMTTAIRRAARELRDVVDGTSDLIVTLDASGAITLANRSFRDLLGFEDAVSSGMPLRELVLASERGGFDEALADLRSGTAMRTIDTTLVSREGTRLEVEGALTHHVDDPGVIRAIFRDVSVRRHSERALRSANETLERLASVDALTGVANRRRFDERLDEELGRVRRTGGVVSLVMLDVDYFKKYNDRYGHPAGDECLRRVASCLRVAARRAGELAGRYGGEEFAMILPGSDATAAREAAEHLRSEIEAMGLPHEAHPLGHVTASFGVATASSSDPLDRSTLIERADAALYRAKEGGRNRVVVHGT